MSGLPPVAARTAFDLRPYERRLVVDRRALNVLDIGSGPALLFLHGWQMSWHAWLPQIAAFANTHRVVVPDLPGFGRSGPLPQASIAGYAHVVAQILDQLGITRGVLIGNSMGGFVAGELALRHPGRVNALVLVAAAGMSRRYVLPKALIRHPLGVLTSWMLTGGEGRRRAWQTMSPMVMHAVFSRPSRVAPEIRGGISGALGAAGAYAAAQACARHEHRDELGAIRCPTLVVWGAEDRLQSVRNAHRYVRAIPHARLQIHAGVGHCPQLENPVRFNRDLVNFLADECLACAQEK